MASTSQSRLSLITVCESPLLPPSRDAIPWTVSTPPSEFDHAAKGTTSHRHKNKFSLSLSLSVLWCTNPARNFRSGPQVKQSNRARNKNASRTNGFVGCDQGSWSVRQLASQPLPRLSLQLRRQDDRGGLRRAQRHVHLGHPPLATRHGRLVRRQTRHQARRVPREVPRRLARAPRRPLGRHEGTQPQDRTVAQGRRQAAAGKLAGAAPF